MRYGVLEGELQPGVATLEAVERGIPNNRGVGGGQVAEQRCVVDLTLIPDEHDVDWHDLLLQDELSRGQAAQILFCLRIKARLDTCWCRKRR
jgi:hypothetical protein